MNIARSDLNDKVKNACLEVQVQRACLIACLAVVSIFLNTCGEASTKPGNAPIASGDFKNDTDIIFTTTKSNSSKPDRNGFILEWTAYASNGIKDQEPIDGKFKDGRYFFGTAANRSFCCNAETMEIIWSSSTPGKAVLSEIINDKIIFATSAGTKSFFYCIDMFNGKEIWNVELDQKFPSNPVLQSDNAILSAGSAIVSVDLNSGKRLWEADLAGSVSKMRLVSHMNLLFCSIDGMLVCLDADNGAKAWEQTVKNDNDSLCSFDLMISGEFIVYQEACNSISCISMKSGKKNWSYKTEDGTSGHSYISNPSIHEGYVFVTWSFSESKSPLHGLACIELATGINVEEISFISPNQILEHMVVGTKIVYLMSSTDNLDRHLGVFDVDSGKDAWVVKIPQNDKCNIIDVLESSILIYASKSFDNGKLISYDINTGKKKWEASLPVHQSVFGKAMIFDGNLLMFVNESIKDDLGVISINETNGLINWKLFLGEGGMLSFCKNTRQDRLIVVTDYFEDSKGSTFWCIDMTNGKLDFKHNDMDNVHNFRLEGDLLYYNYSSYSSDEKIKTLACLNTLNGKTLFKHQSKAKLYESHENESLHLASGQAENHFFIESNNDVKSNTFSLACLDAENGQAAWSRTNVSSYKTNTQHTYVVTDRLGNRKVISKIDTTAGKGIWDFEFSQIKYLDWFVSDNGLVFASTDTHIFCIDDSSGYLSWKTELKLDIIEILEASSNCLAYTKDSKVVLLDGKNGKMIWECNVSQPILKCLVAANLVAVVQVNDITILSLQDGKQLARHKKDGFENCEQLFNDGALIFAPDRYDSETEDEIPSNRTSEIECVNATTGEPMWSSYMGYGKPRELTVFSGDRILLELMILEQGSVIDTKYVCFDRISGKDIWQYKESAIKSSDQNNNGKLGESNAIIDVNAGVVAIGHYTNNDEMIEKIDILDLANGEKLHEAENTYGKRWICKNGKFVFTKGNAVYCYSMKTR